jgi:hypothetical protein
MVSTDSGFYNAPTNKEIGDTDLQSMILSIASSRRWMVEQEFLSEGLVQVCTVNHKEKNQCPREGMFSDSFDKARGRNEG